MTAHAELVAQPLLCAICVIIVGRWWLMRESQLDRLVNQAILVAFVGFLLRDTAITHLLTGTLPVADAAQVAVLARELSLGAILVTVAYVYGIVRLWAGADPTSTWQRQRVYNLVAAAATVVMIIAGMPAQRRGLLIVQVPGWPAVVAWIAFYLPIVATSALVIRITARELRTAGSTVTTRERVLYLAVLVIATGVGLDAVAEPICAAVAVGRGVPARDPDSVKTWGFLVICVCAAVAAVVPLVATVLAATGWDRDGRRCRRLRPLWTDLTNAVPHVVLHQAPIPNRRIRSATQLHRMMVEIRDSLMQLRRYASADFEERSGPLDDPLRRRIAQQLAQAIDIVSGTTTPTTSATARNQPHTRPNDPATELAQLLDLARAWPRSRPVSRQIGRRQPSLTVGTAAEPNTSHKGASSVPPQFPNARTGPRIATAFPK